MKLYYRQRKRKNNNEGFDQLHILLLIHVYALAQIRQVKLKRPVENYVWYDTGSRHASRRQRGLQVTVVYHSRRLFVHSGLTNELGVRKESGMGLILLSGDDNMCIVDTDRKIQEEDCWKVIKIHLSVM